MSGADIEARLRRVEAELAIRRILFDYSVHLDAGDWKAYVALFMPDGEWENADGHYKGRDAIEEMLRTMAGPSSRPGFPTFHLNGNERIDLDGDRATAVSRYMFVMRAPDDMPRTSLAGMYHDEFVRIGETWLIAKRAAFEIIPTHAEWMVMNAG